MRIQSRGSTWFSILYIFNNMRLPIMEHGLVIRHGRKQWVFAFNFMLVTSEDYECEKKRVGLYINASSLLLLVLRTLPNRETTQGLSYEFEAKARRNKWEVRRSSQALFSSALVSESVISEPGLEEIIFCSLTPSKTFHQNHFFFLPYE